MSSILQFPVRERASAAESSKLLKRALAARFPSTKFSVTIDRGTAYGCASVRWTDGPTVALVDEVVNPFKGQGFDGSTDSSYHIKTWLPDGRASGLRLISTSREISYTLACKAAAQVADYFGVAVPVITLLDEKCQYWRVENDNRAVPQFNEYWSTMIYRAASDASRYRRPYRPVEIKTQPRIGRCPEHGQLYPCSGCL
jgi:hypothetical protein